MKYIYLSIDIEEWYELEYLKDYHLESTGIEVVPKIIDFLDMLDELQIKATFFVIADLLVKDADIIREISSRGHVIGCHGLNHILLYEKSNEIFLSEIKIAKQQLESVINNNVEGYRASCFSMDRDKLELVKEAGYQYDSSKILFKQHPLYRDLDLSGFKKIDDLVYNQGTLFEYEIPTLNIGKFDIPISGGGYLRLLPFCIIKKLINIYEKNHDNFLIYVHPFELTNIKLPFPKEVPLKNKLRANIGRKSNIKKLKKLLIYYSRKGSEFRTLSQDRNLRMEAGKNS